jgi:hypothetical protein
MFGRRKQGREAGSRPPPKAPADVYTGLRNQILALDPASIGLASDGDADRPWGFVMDMGMPHGCATLVCLRDGTTSLYTSSGFGIIGGGGHQAVVDANAALLDEVASKVASMPPDNDATLPSPGHVVLRALTQAGPRVHRAAEDDLGYERDPMSSIFHAAHAVITELRVIEEAREEKS